MKKLFNAIIRDEEGQGMVEYGLIIAGIAVVVVVVINTLGPAIAGMFTDIQGNF
jgi:pilus assembly protein Flp/PilA